MVLNIKFNDGNEFLYYNDDTTCCPGCETCDYGSEYINDVFITTTNYEINANFNQMYEYAFDTATAISIFATDLRNMSEEEFVEYVEKEFRKISALTTFDKRKR